MLPAVYCQQGIYEAAVAAHYEVDIFKNELCTGERASEQRDRLDGHHPRPSTALSPSADMLVTDLLEDTLRTRLPGLRSRAPRKRFRGTVDSTTSAEGTLGSSLLRSAFDPHGRVAGIRAVSALQGFKSCNSCKTYKNHNGTEGAEGTAGAGTIDTVDTVDADGPRSPVDAPEVDVSRRPESAGPASSLSTSYAARDFEEHARARLLSRSGGNTTLIDRIAPVPSVPAIPDQAYDSMAFTPTTREGKADALRGLQPNHTRATGFAAARPYVRGDMLSLEELSQVYKRLKF